MFRRLPRLRDVRHSFSDQKIVQAFQGLKIFVRIAFSGFVAITSGLHRSKQLGFDLFFEKVFRLYSTLLSSQAGGGSTGGSIVVPGFQTRQ